MRRTKNDKTARMCRLILVFVGHTCQKVRFLTMRLSYMFWVQDFSFLNGNYYIAMDLYEYTLDEYLYKLKTDGQDTSLCTNKLIWQFLRGLNGIHQHCLMIHGEIRVRLLNFLNPNKPNGPPSVYIE